MPNRILKETLLASRKLNEVSAEAERLYTRLLLVVDDFGRYVADADVLASKAFPRRRGADVDAEVSRCLSELAGAGLIEVYVVRSDRLIEVVNFQVHNKPRADKSRFPSREEGQSFLGLASADKCSQGSTGVDIGPPMRPLSGSLPLSGPSALPSAPQELLSSADDAPVQPSLIDVLPARPDPTEAKIDQVLAHWQRAHGPNIDVAGETQAGKERRRRVRKHLNAKIPVEQMLAAIDGALRDAYIMGRDPKAPRAYRGVETILRDGTQIEKLAALKGGPNAPAAPQAASNRVPVAPPVVPMDWTASGELSRALNRPAFLGGPDDFRLPANREIPLDFKLPDGMKVVRVDPVPDRKVP